MAEELLEGEGGVLRDAALVGVEGGAVLDVDAAVVGAVAGQDRVVVHVVGAGGVEHDVQRGVGVARERLVGAEHAVVLGLHLLARVVQLVDGGPVQRGADLDGTVVVGVGVGEELLLDVLLAHPVRLAGLVEVEPGDDLGPRLAAVAEGGADGAEHRAEVGDDPVPQALDLAEAGVLAQRVAHHPGVARVLEVRVGGEGLEGVAVGGVGGHRGVEGGVLVARVDAQVGDGEGGQRGARPAGVEVGGRVGGVHGGQDLLNEAELVLAQAGRAAGVEGLAQGAGVGGRRVEGVGGGAEVGDGAAHGVDGGGVGDVDLGARVVVVGDRVQVREHLLQVGGVTAVVGGGQAGYPAGDGLDVRVRHDRGQTGVPGPDEPAQAAVGEDGLVAEEVGELLRGETGDPVEGAGDARGDALRGGGRLDRLAALLQVVGGRGGGRGRAGDLPGDVLPAGGRGRRRGVVLRVGQAVDLVERVPRGAGGGGGRGGLCAGEGGRGRELGGLGGGLSRGGEEGHGYGGGEEGRAHSSVLEHRELLIGEGEVGGGA